LEEKIKILVTLGSLGIGGNEMFAMNLFRHINKAKFHMDFVVYDNNRLDYFDEVIKGGSKVFFCESNKKNKIRQLIDQKHKVLHILNQEKYDIIHCNSCSFFGMLPGVLAGRKAGIKVISHSHNVGRAQNNWLDKILRGALKKVLCNQVDYGFSCSDFAGNSKYTESFIKSNRYMVINNAIETKDYIFDETKRKSARSEFGIQDDEFVIGHVGRFEEQKNQIFLIDIFYELIKMHPKSRLLFIGTGSLFEKCKEKVKKLEIEQRVIFAGQRDDVSKLYNAMDCLAFPSLFEGFPFVLVEAQINGLKCIVSDRISKSVKITRGVCFLNLDDTKQTWAEHIRDSINSRMGEEDLSNAIKLYDLDNSTRYIEKLYLRLLR
jgi:glycosyltransferase involved in cell wall biosynthesis